MTIRRWEPRSDLRHMEEALARMWCTFPRPGLTARFWLGERILPLTAYQTADALVVRTPIPGVKPEDIEVTIEGNTLTVRGERGADEELKDADYILQERCCARFYRSMTLPGGLNTEQTDATYKDGILNLVIPKREDAKAKAIPVKGGDEVKTKAK
jgi:HSP20 family protein